jgi:glycosyltransferase involved in cell wall biosynthesis
MKIVQLTTDAREHYRDYANPRPFFGTAPEALLQGFASQPDVEVHVVACVRRFMPTPVQLADNVWHHTLVVPKWGWMSTLYQGCIRAVRRKLRELEPDIVHGQGTERDCALTAVRSGYPNVTTIHGNMAELARMFGANTGSFHWLAGKLENYALKRTAGVFCNSAYTEEVVRPRARRVWRVPNALRNDFFKPRTSLNRPARPTLLCVGVVTPRKRQLELLDVAAGLHKRGLDCEWQFVGEASAHNDYGAAFLKKLAPMTQAGFARHIGSKKTGELIECLDSASALVHFPLEESFGLVVAEALARDLKLFGGRVGGIVDIASGLPGVDLFDVNDWEGLQEGLATWLCAGCPKAVGASRTIAERYSPLVVAKRHVEIYREVLSTRS